MESGLTDAALRRLEAASLAYRQAEAESDHIIRTNPTKSALENAFKRQKEKTEDYINLQQFHIKKKQDLQMRLAQVEKDLAACSEEKSGLLTKINESRGKMFEKDGIVARTRKDLQKAEEGLVQCQKERASAEQNYTDCNTHRNEVIKEKRDLQDQVARLHVQMEQNKLQNYTIDQQIVKLKQEIASLQAGDVTAQSQLSDARARIATLETQLNQSNLELLTANAGLQEYLHQLHIVKNEQESTRQELESARKSASDNAESHKYYEDLTIRCQNLSSEFEIVNQQIIAQNDRIKALEIENDALQTEHAKEQSELQQRLNTSNQERKDFVEQLKMSNERHADLMQQLHECEEEKAQIESERAETFARLTQYASELAELEAKIKQADRDLSDANRQLQQCKNQKEECETEKVRQQAEIHTLTQQIQRNGDFSALLQEFLTKNFPDSASAATSTVARLTTIQDGLDRCAREKAACEERLRNVRTLVDQAANNSITDRHQIQSLQQQLDECNSNQQRLTAEKQALQGSLTASQEAALNKQAQIDSMTKTIKELKVKEEGSNQEYLALDETRKKLVIELSNLNSVHAQRISELTHRIQKAEDRTHPQSRQDTQDLRSILGWYYMYAPHLQLHPDTVRNRAVNGLLEYTVYVQDPMNTGGNVFPISYGHALGVDLVSNATKLQLIAMIKKASTLLSRQDIQDMIALLQKELANENVDKVIHLTNQLNSMAAQHAALTGDVSPVNSLQQSTAVHG